MEAADYPLTDSLQVLRFQRDKEFLRECLLHLFLGWSGLSLIKI
jgi:hypothetical protein